MARTFIFSHVFRSILILAAVPGGHAEIRAAGVTRMQLRATAESASHPVVRQVVCKRADTAAGYSEEPSPGVVVSRQGIATTNCADTGNQPATVAASNFPLASASISAMVSASSVGGQDIGSKINAAIAQIGCGTIYIPQGRYVAATVIHKPRCVILQGSGPTLQDNIIGGFGTVIVSSANPALVISDGPTSQTES